MLDVLEYILTHRSDQSILKVEPAQKDPADMGEMFHKFVTSRIFMEDIVNPV